jgi:Uma2 family endonuclease
MVTQPSNPVVQPEPAAASVRLAATIADLAQLPDDGFRYELVRGVLLRMPPPKRLHGVICHHLHKRLDAWCAAHGLADDRVEENIGYNFTGDAPNATVLAPDISLAQEATTLVADAPYETTPPLLAVEVASPSKSYTLHREESEQLGIRYVQAALSTWTPPQHAFDYVIANMVLMDIPDYVAALKTCVAALSIGGGFIFSILHPCFEESGSTWKEKGYVAVQDYFQERAVQQTYGYFIHRPLSVYLNSVMEAGCMLQKIIEPQLEKTIAESHDAERYWSVPGYLIVFAKKVS